MVDLLVVVVHLVVVVVEVEIKGFKKIYSRIVPDYFLNLWMSEDGFCITKALRGGGYHLVHLENNDGVYNKPLEELIELHKLISK